MTQGTDDFGRLAAWHGLQPSFCDVFGNHHSASTDTLLAALRCLGVPIDRPDQASDLLRDAHRKQARQVVEPVVVIWDGDPQAIDFQLPVQHLPQSVACRIHCENGDTLDWNTSTDELESNGQFEVGGEQFRKLRCLFPAALPIGYHPFELHTEHGTFHSLLLTAPRRAYAQTNGEGRRWGAFLPLYALHSERSWGSGDLTDLADLNAWIVQQGGNLVATLPLLASFFGSIGNTSPYRPASRLFWNEFYLDVTRIPELGDCPAALQQLESDEFRAEIARLQASPLVDYDRQMAAKRRVLECLAEHFFTGPSSRRAQFEDFLREHPDADLYARFRAVGEKRGIQWRDWPAHLRDGRITPDDFDPAAYHYHAFAQWQVHEQLTWNSRQAASLGLTWYLDLPVGVHPDGFDTWRQPDVFALNASAGAPPDAFFTAGQCWELPPFHPTRLREQGYQHFRAILHAHLRFARLLRIDHVMGLHRLYWIPENMDAKDGLYVRYPANELYAILALESQRHSAEIIGENLGTVPPEVDATMNDHGIGQLFVTQFAAKSNPHAAVPDVPANAVASMNTHDTPPFAAFWIGLDINDRLKLELIDEEEAEAQRQHRAALRQSLEQFLREKGLLEGSPADAQAVLTACLALLGKSSAEVVLVNLEDMWLETASQNTPGTSTERINWRHKAKYPMEQFDEQGVGRLLQIVAAARRGD